MCHVKVKMVIIGIATGGMNSGGDRLHVAVSILLNICKYNVHGNEKKENIHLFRFAFVISFRRAAPSKGLRSSNAQSKSSDTLCKTHQSHYAEDFGGTHLMQAP
jgi:hypothetical protein